MPYTAAQLNQFYTNVNQGMMPDAATQAVFASYATQNGNGTLTDAQTISLVTNTAQTRATTDVALATYQFFTGSAPTTGATGGLNYLINTPGSGFNTSYFNGTGATASATAPGTGGFNLENRYYNESVALATNATTGAAFVSAYGSLSLNDTVRVAYEQIVGTGSVGTANAAAAIANIQGLTSYFTQVAQRQVGNIDAGGTAGQNIALKAVIVGYILEEGIKADVGTYAKAIDNFNAANAQAATATGVAPTGSNLITNYAPGTAGDTLGGTTTGSTGIAGVTIAYAAGNNVSLTSADPAFRSTVNNDTLNATGAVINGVSIDLNGGNDNVIAGTIGATGGTAATSLSLGGGNDTIGTQAAPTLIQQATGAAAQAAATIVIDGGAGTDVAHFSVAAAGIAAGAATVGSVTITGVETVYFQATANATVAAGGITGATALWHEGANNLTFTGVTVGTQAGVSGATGTSSFTYAGAVGGAETLNLVGSNGATTIAGQLATDTLTLAHTANSTVAGLTSSASTIVDTGTTEINLGTVTISGAPTSDSINLSTAARSALNFSTSATGATGTDTVTLGAGADVLGLGFGVQKNSTITLGAGADTVTVAGTAGTAYVEGVGGTASGGNVTVNASGAVSTFAQISDFAKGVDHINVELNAGTYTNSFANPGYVGAASLTAAATIAAGAATGAGSTTVFEFQGSTYIFQQDATAGLNSGDTLIQLVGVTGAAVNNTAGGTNTGDIHFG